MSQRLQNSLHKIADEISATEINKQAWLSYATTSGQPPVLIRRKTVILAAALIAVLMLAGFAFVKSVYFDKIFGEPFTMSSPRLDNDDLQKLLVDLSPGDVLNTEIETADGTVVVKAICGDTLDAVAYGIKGDNSIHSGTFPHDPVISEKTIEERLETIKGLKVDHSNNLKDRIAAGEFIAALDSPDYTLEYILLRDGKTDTLLYKGKSGETIQVVPISGQLFMDEKSQESALISDKTIDGRTFTVMEHPDESGQISVFLYIGDNFATNSIALYNFDPRSGATIATKEQMLDAAKHLVLYNEQANLPMEDVAKNYYNEAFFRKINDPVISGAAKEIAASIHDAEKDENNPRIAVWGKDGRSISVDILEDHISLITLDYKNIEYTQTLKLLSLPEQSSFDSEVWFSPDNLQSAVINYYEGRLTSAFWYSEDYTSTMNIRYVSDLEIGKTPLDTLAISNVHFIENTLIKIVKAKDGSPYLISSVTTPDGKIVISVTATKKYGGKTLLYQFRLDEDRLPGGSVDKWVNTF